MKRLRELEPDHRLMARTHELIDALGPTIPSQARMHRVRRALDEPEHRSRRVWAMRAVLAFTIVCGGASALAFSGVFSRPVEPPVRGSLTSPSVVPPAAPVPVKASRPVEASSEPNEDTVAAPAHRTSARSRSGEPFAASSASASDVARVHEAAKALRADGDPQRALRLLESSQNVGGPLAEEALALRIEAANASHDSRAKSLAQRYLSRYPDGRYRDLAQRTLADH